MGQQGTEALGLGGVLQPRGAQIGREVELAAAQAEIQRPGGLDDAGFQERTLCSGP